MRSVVFIGLSVLSMLGQIACSPEEEVPIPSACDSILARFDSTFGIQYSEPDAYLSCGEQSCLDPAYINQLKARIGPVSKPQVGAASVARWVLSNFKFVNEGGGNIGRVTANDLYEKHETYGCHSQALIISSILRSYGFPCVLVETASVKWAYDYREDPNIGYIGHVMTEVYVRGAWMLLDNNGAFVREYSPTNPFISTSGTYHSNPAPQGYFVIAKGIDTWAYGVRSPEDTGELMRNFANHLPCYKQYFGTSNYVWI